MSAPTLLDALLFAAFAVGYPAYGYLTWPRFLSQVRQGLGRARARAYVETIALEWVLALALLGWWAMRERPWSLLGLGSPLVGAGAWASLAVAVVGALAFVHARGVARASAEQLVAAAGGLGDVVQFMPRTAVERRLFAGVALTAGACEELFFRGLAPWLLSAWLSSWAALAVATALFGLAHAYQGAAGVAKSAAVGAVMAALTGWAGTIWPAIVLHAIVDLHGGSVGGRIARAVPEGPRDVVGEAPS